MITHYILDGKIPVEADMYTWLAWIKTFERKRHVCRTRKRRVSVSTVFLPYPAITGFTESGNAKYLFFETMVFGGKFDGLMYRYTTWEQAEAGHVETCKEVFGEKYRKYAEMSNFCSPGNRITPDQWEQIEKDREVYLLNMKECLSTDEDYERG